MLITQPSPWPQKHQTTSVQLGNRVFAFTPGCPRDGRHHAYIYIPITNSSASRHIGSATSRSTVLQSCWCSPGCLLKGGRGATSARSLCCCLFHCQHVRYDHSEVECILCILASSPNKRPSNSAKNCSC